MDQGLRPDEGEAERAHPPSDTPAEVPLLPGLDRGAAGGQPGRDPRAQLEEVVSPQPSALRSDTGAPARSALPPATTTDSAALHTARRLLRRALRTHWSG